MLKFFHREHSKYLTAYLGFLKIEIPSVLQILTLLTLISFLGNNYIFSLLVIVLVFLLTKWYLNEKLLIFLNNELKYYIEEKDRIDNKNTIISSLIVYNVLVSLVTSAALGSLSTFIFFTPICNLLRLFLKDFRC